MSRRWASRKEDCACARACGLPWMGRFPRAGLVLVCPTRPWHHVHCVQVTNSRFSCTRVLSPYPRLSAKGIPGSCWHISQIALDAQTRSCSDLWDPCVDLWPQGSQDLTNRESYCAKGTLRRETSASATVVYIVLLTWSC